MGALTIRKMAWIYLAFILVAGCAIIGSSMLVARQLDKVSVSWTGFQSVASEKDLTLNILLAEIGYGGMIHEFMDYVIRQDQARLDTIAKKFGGISAVINQYKAYQLDEDEQGAIAELEKTVNAFVGKSRVARGLAMAQQPPEKVMKIVKVDETAALGAIETLMEKAGGHGEETDEADPSRIGLLVHLRRHLGFGGVIHYLKEYSLTHDAVTFEKIEENLAEAERVVGLYRRVARGAEELEAVELLAGVVASYRSVVGETKAYVEKGHTAAEIDMALRSDSAEALGAIRDLTRAAMTQKQQAATGVEAALLSSQFLTQSTKIISAILVAMLIGASFWLLRIRISNPITDVTSIMTSLAQGDADATVSQGLQARTDEIGIMAGAVTQWRQSLLDRQRLEREKVNAEAQAKEREQQALLDLSNTLESSVAAIMSELTEAASRVGTTAEGLTGTADTAREEASKASNATDQTSRNVHTISEAAGQLRRSIEEIAQQANEVSTTAGRAVGEVQSADEIMKDLSGAADRIGEVINLISDIAEQTNLLALNATIEAARAGDAGRGFAVVASEVKNLASQTARATDQVAELITRIQGSTGSAVTRVETISDIIERLDRIATAIAKAVDLQSHSTNDIASHIQSAVGETDRMKSTVTSVNDAAEETRTAAEDMSSASTHLQSQSDRLNAAVKDFLSNLRAA